MEDFNEIELDLAHSLFDFAGGNSQPTTPTSRCEGNKNPLWDFIWQNQTTIKYFKGTDSDHISLLAEVAEVSCGFPQTTMTTRPRSRLERKKNPLWGFIWKDQTTMEESKGTDSDHPSLLAEVSCGFPQTTVTRSRSRLERKKKPLWGFKSFKDIVLSKDREDGLIKRKRQSKEEDEEEWEEPKPKRRKRKACPNPIPDQPPLLPETLRQRIAEKGGSDLKFVIQKSLFVSDLNEDLGRLSIPVSQVRTPFLTQTEAAFLELKTKDKGRNVIGVGLIEPSMKETGMKLSKWPMTSPIYALNPSNLWKTVWEENGLKVNDIVRIWSFRVDSKLWFALVKV